MTILKYIFLANSFTLPLSKTQSHGAISQLGVSDVTSGWMTPLVENNRTIIWNPTSGSIISKVGDRPCSPACFHSAVCQRAFETKSRKLSKMWLPPLNFTQADQRRLLEGGIRAAFSQHLSCASERTIRFLTQAFHPKILFICPVTRATPEHNKHYTQLDIILRLCETHSCVVLQHNVRL